MKLLNTIFNRTTEKKSASASELRRGPARIRGRYDAAQTTNENQKHWAAADGFSADMAASPEVRKALRERSRYEVANNSYARGIVLTLANDTIGTGPRLQMLTEDACLNREIENEFSSWSQSIGLAAKLRTMRMARCQDGESFAVLADNPSVGHPVQLDLQLIEADRVTSELSFNQSDDEIDGIRLDAFGNPVSYRVLRYHPGGAALDYQQKAVIIPASSMIHVFRSDRPELHRGIPEITPALGLFAQLRRFTLAVLTAAESAANFAGILYTDAPATGEADAVEPMDLIELERNMLLTMPGGWKMSQLDPKQPATTYAEFKKEILNEIARCLNMPFNVAAGNSSGYNYSSGRLDHQTYYKAIRIDQAFTASNVLDRILQSWLLEYSMFRGDRFASLPTHQWFWDGMEHVDPYKEANAQAARLKSKTTTLAYEYARQGRDWEEELRQLAREKKVMTELGLIEIKPKPAQESFQESNT
ncbi:phage portal protein, lambda family [Anaerohalosphaera lusitana]|uniref:Phage portal protein, lambda family n=1 Tax=Anaerohalosphaera lusitana TaxID=1936003 RepID=A0A1U9NJF5_9BACT|nr:phage portal protein [Anaerohalosphaera lusitana]AQT67937.1 phage portal protein, lambda family [Anaerohalosphaera lusitana]